MRNRNRRAFRTLHLATLLGVTAVGIQACGEDSATGLPTSARSFTLSPAPAAVAVLQGGDGESTIAITRAGGFTGSVALAVTGAPAGVTATISPTTTTGATATLLVSTTAAAPAGSVALTITGAAVGLPDQTTTTTVTIAENKGGTGNVIVDFSPCPVTNRPVWFAAQDGAGAWTQVLGVADVYRFNVASAKGGYAFVSRDARTLLTVSLGTQGELTGAAISPCGSPPSALKTVSGTVAGLGAGDVAYVGLGGPNSDPEGGPITPSAPSFTLARVPDGPQDLIAFRTSPAALGARGRMIIRRDQNVADNGAVGVVDFDGPESFAPSAAVVTVAGSGAPSGHFMSYYAGASCSHYDLYDGPATSANFPVYGVPASQQRATDFHTITVFASNPIRVAVESFHTLADRVVALPAALPAPTITTPSGGHKRVQASLTLPADYQASLQLWFYNQDGTAHVTASSGWLGGATATLAVPDLSAVTGWRSSFLPPTGASVFWFLTASGANSAASGGSCEENARFVTAYLDGRA